MRRVVVAGIATMLLLGGCSLLPFRQKDVPPKPINGQLCDAIDAETIELFMKNAQLKQGTNPIGLEKAAGFNDAYCEASGDDSRELRVNLRRFGQTSERKPAEQAADEIGAACNDMRSGRWLDQQRRTAPDATADPMTTPTPIGDKVCQITEVYTGATGKMAGLELAFRKGADVVRIRYFRPVVDEPAQVDHAKWIMGINAQLLAVDLLTAEL